MSLRACLAWGRDASGLGVCSCTTLGNAPGDSEVISTDSKCRKPWLAGKLILLGEKVQQTLQPEDQRSGEEGDRFAEVVITKRLVNFRGLRCNQCNFLNITLIRKIIVPNAPMTSLCTVYSVCVCVGGDMINSALLLPAGWGWLPASHSMFSEPRELCELKTFSQSVLHFLFLLALKMATT